MNALLEARNLVKVYPGLRAVDGVSFEVRRGSCFGLLGPNGAGKTTTLEMLEGISAPTSGKVLYRGCAPDRRFREEIGIQFQSTALQDFQTVREALRMFASLYRHTADFDELVAMCNLAALLDRDTRKLSGGQRQRLLLAIALVNDPQLLFLDEPTTGLDPQSRRNFWGLIEEVRRRGKTLVLTTHYMEEAQRLCDEILIADRGRVIAHGRPSELVQERFPASVVRLPVSAFSGRPALPEGWQLRNGEMERFCDNVPALLEQLARAGIDLRELRVEKPSLEDLFLKLTGHGLRS